jgi:hypothetical protein
MGLRRSRTFHPSPPVRETRGHVNAYLSTRDRKLNPAIKVSAGNALPVSVNTAEHVPGTQIEHVCGAESLRFVELSRTRVPCERTSVPIVNNGHPCNRRMIAHSLPTRVLKSEVANRAFAILPYVGCLR